MLRKASSPRGIRLLVSSSGSCRGHETGGMTSSRLSGPTTRTEHKCTFYAPVRPGQTRSGTALRPGYSPRRRCGWPSEGALCKGSEHLMLGRSSARARVPYQLQTRGASLASLSRGHAEAEVARGELSGSALRRGDAVAAAVGRVAQVGAAAHHAVRCPRPGPRGSSARAARGSSRGRTSRRTTPRRCRSCCSSPKPFGGNASTGAVPR